MEPNDRWKAVRDRFRKLTVLSRSTKTLAFIDEVSSVTLLDKRIADALQAEMRKCNFVQHGQAISTEMSKVRV